MIHLYISKINLFFQYVPQISNDTQVAEDPCKDSRYKEPLIDAMRKQKDEVINEDITVLIIRGLSCFYLFRS